jgi:hypothetical protein
MRRRKIAVSIAALTALLGIAVVGFLVWPYDSSQFQGDGIITDHGPWSWRPRFEIRFPQVSLAAPGEHTFICKGLPPAPLTFYLDMADRKKKEEQTHEFLQRHPTLKSPAPAEKDKYQEIVGNRSTLDFTLSCDEQTIRSIRGSLKTWSLAWAPGENTGGFWHADCREIRFNPKRTYKFTLVIKEADPNSPPLEIVPALYGGGFEGP